MPTILYAEDDSDHRAMMRLALQHTNFSLIEAVDGEDALIKIFSLKPDIILLDLFMPNLDGFGVMDAVKSNPAAKRIPIVALSAWPTGDNRQRILQAGATEFVPKPYDPFKLIQILQSLLTPKSGFIPSTVKSDTAPLMA
jgi:CheY-like chemotaxis protein